MLHLKELWGWCVGEKVTLLDENILEELEGLPGGRPWEAGTLLRHGYDGEAEDRCPSNREIMAHWYSLSNDYLQVVCLLEDSGLSSRMGNGKTGPRRFFTGRERARQLLQTPLVVTDWHLLRNATIQRCEVT